MRLKRLQDGLLIALLAAASLLAGVAAPLAYWGAFNRALSQGEDTLNGLLIAVEKTATIGAYAGDAILLQEVVDGLSLNPLAGFVEVRDPSGRPWVSSVGNNRPAQADAGGLWVERALHSPFDRTETTGTLRIEANMAVLRASARAQASVLASIMLGQSLGVALLLYLLATRLVSRPIVQLADRLRSMVPGSMKHLDVPPMHEHDELGALVRSANTLLSNQDEALQRERVLRAEIAKLGAEYETIFSASSAGIFVMTREMRLMHCNARARSLSGWVEANADTGADAQFVDTTFAQPEILRNMIRQAIVCGNTEAADLALRGSGGITRWVHCLITARAALQGHSAETPAVIEGVMYDITERKQAELASRHRAEHDPLTGLNNRRGCDVTLATILDGARSSGTSVCVLYLDLDGFKSINDRYGHASGDNVLMEVARRIRTQVRRGSDLCARVGGDEFLVALCDTDERSPHLCESASELLASVGAPIPLEGGLTVNVGVSIGIACYPRHGQNAPALVHSADLAMYEVKRTGKHAFAMAFLPPLAEADATGGPHLPSD